MNVNDGCRWGWRKSICRQWCQGMIDYICLIVLHVVFGNSNALTPLQYARSLCQGIIKDSNLFYITFFYVLPFKGELEKKNSLLFFFPSFIYIQATKKNDWICLLFKAHENCCLVKCFSFLAKWEGKNVNDFCCVLCHCFPFHYIFAPLNSLQCKLTNTYLFSHAVTWTNVQGSFYYILQSIVSISFFRSS